jgi:hypothetical protein
MGFASLTPSYDAGAKKVRPGFGGSPAARGPDLGDGEGWGRDRDRVVVTRATRAGLQIR